MVGLTILLYESTKKCQLKIYMIQHKITMYNNFVWLINNKAYNHQSAHHENNDTHIGSLTALFNSHEKYGSPNDKFKDYFDQLTSNFHICNIYCRRLSSQEHFLQVSSYKELGGWGKFLL